ncbi:acetylglutamate kinase [Staphylococcus pseudoxylosus]|uniref:acetylglutamate kinase n=1 Tax=Staphylococcus pseudoxylosus TaxID=2282419 RepID=UPI000D1EFD28|nr:acetylglutamate kinase [Staphylococcus pseudoxylosus]MEB5782513.1 acetylglutamate kinase [Staphylococcus pseudoxylosus]PTI83915.1 acetylglutamate kinase [Staphylococcus xylosus]
MSYIVIKIGGSTLTNLHDSTIEDVSKLKQQGYQPIIVHGGGPFINKALEQRGVAPLFEDGLRVTTEEVLSVTSQTLIGTVNPDLVSKINQSNIQSIGMNGIDAKLFDVAPLDEKYGYVGEPKDINTSVFDKVTDQFIPVIASIGMNQATSQLYNINADTLAYKIAQALHAPLYLLSDIPGVLIDKEVQPSLNAERIQCFIDQELIYGGMIPKVQDAIQAIELGCQKVVIAAGSESHIIQKLQDGENVGTTIQQ